MALVAPVPTRSDGWVDIDPETPRCLRMVYRFRVDDLQAGLHSVHGWCEPVSVDGKRAAQIGGGDGGGSRPYFRDAVAADRTWIGSNTTRWCGADMDDVAGWTRVACRRTTAIGEELSVQTVLLSWVPVSNLVMRNEHGLHGGSKGYVLAWDELQVEDGLSDLTDWRPYLPRVQRSTRIVNDCLHVSVLFHTVRSGSSNVAVEEDFCPTRGRTDYSHHSPAHAPYDRRAGMAFYFLQRSKDSSVDVMDAQREFYEDEKEWTQRARRSVGSRVNKVRRLSKSFWVKWV